MGNVTAVNTTLASGQTDNQVFCYDEQDRLTWAGSTGTPPSSCGQSLTPGSLSAAYYTQSFSYDAYDRLTSGPLGSYTYGDTNHLHAATAVGSGPTPTYTASYDGAGNMVCRAPNPAVGSCALGQNTGQQLAYDAEGRLSHWQNVPGNTPDSNASFRYDGEGERVAQQSASSGTTTTTRYPLGGIEELTTVGSTSTLTKYYSVPGVVTAIKVGSTLSYLATDGLGSVSVALSVAGSTTGQALYLPYGAGRYSSGSLPTARGYTGQYQDSTSGLDYYGARSYDPALGQFTSADTVLDGLNRYGYVGDNPTTATDPSGHGAVACFGTNCSSPVEVPVYPGRPPQANEPTGGGGGGNGVQGVITALIATVGFLGNLVANGWDALGAQPAAPALPAWYGHSDTLSDHDAIQAATHNHVVGSSGPYIHMGSTGWRPINNRTTPDTQTPTPTGPQPQPGGGGGFGNGAPPLGTGGACGCGDGGDGEGGSGGEPGAGQWRVWVSQKGISIVEAHLSGEFSAPWNDAMIARLKDALEAGVPITGADANFYLHELSETTFMAGGLDYTTAHEAALAKYGVSRFSVYHPDVILKYRSGFNSNWLNFWGLSEEC